MVLLPTQPNLDRAETATYHPQENIFFPVSATVVGIHYPYDNDGKEVINHSGNQIEYDLACDYNPFGTLQNVPLAVGLHGATDDDEIILRVAKENTLNHTDTADAGSRLGSDGDRVLVQFVNGSWSSPVITNILSHPMRASENLVRKGSRYAGKLKPLTTKVGERHTFGDGTTGSTEADLEATLEGERFRHTRINGTHMAIDRNGDVFLNFEEHWDKNKNLVSGKVYKKLVIQNEGQDLLRIERRSSDDGYQVTILADADGQTNTILQVGDGAKSVALAEYLETQYASLKAEFDDHKHPYVSPAGPTAVDTGTPAQILPAIKIFSFPAWDSKIASSTVKIPDES